MYELVVRRHFDAAHRLVGYGGKCENLHGHRYTAEVVLRTPRLNGIGLAVDFDAIKGILDQVLPDHQYVNDLLPAGFNASAERIAEWLFGRVRERVRSLGVDVVKMTVWESPDCGASYFEVETEEVERSGDGYRARPEAVRPDLRQTAGSVAGTGGAPRRLEGVSGERRDG